MKQKDETREKVGGGGEEEKVKRSLTRTINPLRWEKNLSFLDVSIFPKRSRSGSEKKVQSPRNIDDIKWDFVLLASHAR